MALAPGKVYRKDCIQGLAEIATGSIDLAFADPPFNIGYEYDVYDDRRAADEYLDWSKKWITGVHRALKPAGTFWLAIGDEFAAELKLIAQNDAGFHCRSWVIWYYTFGVNCKYGFSRSHTHLFHFVKDPRKFTFNADNPAVRVPSARQLVYADARANPKGRLPDNTWILRPQDAPPGGFALEHDTWYYPRVAGTFSEREGFHGCQMPEQILGRIIRCCSNPTDVVLDPFGGSGTTFTVAKKLGRRWIGFELSDDYARRINERLRKASPGDRLDGVEDPLRSVPDTASGRARGDVNSKLPAPRLPNGARGAGRNGTAKGRAGQKNGAAHQKHDAERRALEAELIDAYRCTARGATVDHLLADPEISGAFVAECRKRKLPGTPAQWNHALVGLRKSARLPRSKRRSKQERLTFVQMDAYSHAAEVATQLMRIEYGRTLDELLCDPALAEVFDRTAGQFAPGHSPLEYRWAALAIRKRAKEAKRLAAQQFAEWLTRRLPKAEKLGKLVKTAPAAAGAYLLIGPNRQVLYAGETLNLAERLAQVRNAAGWRELEPETARVIHGVARPYGLQSILIRRAWPMLNWRALAAEPQPAEV